MAAQLPIVLTNGISHTYSKREKITYQEMFDTASTGTKYWQGNDLLRRIKRVDGEGGRSCVHRISTEISLQGA